MQDFGWVSSIRFGVCDHSGPRFWAEDFGSAEQMILEYWAEAASEIRSVQT